MIKAVFIDYTGTMVKEDDPYSRELLGYFLAHSTLQTPQEAMKVVWTLIKEIETKSFGEAFLNNDEKVDRILDHCAAHYALDGDREYIHTVWRKIWVHAPLYEDVKPFFESSALPIYVISNDDLCFIEESMKLKGLCPAGIVTADMAGACKPHRAIFDKALEMAGVLPSEVIHIGDSVISDVEAAKAVGITPVYIARGQSTALEGVRVISSLYEIADLLKV